MPPLMSNKDSIIALRMTRAQGQSNAGSCSNSGRVGSFVVVKCLGGFICGRQVFGRVHASHALQP